MSDWILETLHFLQSPPGVGICSGLVTGGLGAGIANGIQQREANVFPVLYSGIDRVTEPNKAARFYAACSDMTMAVTEAWNAGRAAKKDEAMQKHLQGGRLTRYGQEVFVQGKLLLGELQQHMELLNVLRTAVNELQGAWEYDSTDNYRTETYTETYTDSDGNTQTRTETRQVYEDTDHYFTFDRPSASRACTGVDAVLIFDPHAMYEPKLGAYEVEPDTTTGDAGTGGPYRSRGSKAAPGSRTEREYVRDTVLEDRKAQVSDQQLTEFLNVWLRFANLSGDLARTSRGVDALRRAAPQSKRTMMESAPSYHYNTTSTSHSGPIGYRAAQVMLDNGQLAFSNLNDALSTIGACTARGELLAKIGRGEFPEDWEPENFAEKTLDVAVECYLASFPGSPLKMDQRVRSSKTLWTALIAGFLGGLAGLLLHPQSGLVTW